MMRQPWTSAERRRILDARSEALARYNSVMERIETIPAGSDEEFDTADAAEVEMLAAEQAEREYYSGLPRVTVSCCPFDAKPLVRTFDPFGDDGLWWRPDAVPEEVVSCPHYCFWRGARDGGFPGVIPRILEMPGVVAVLSRVEMNGGAWAHVVSYFAERRPAAQDLAADWPRDVYAFVTALGKHRWHYDDAGRDLDLRHWLARGKIRWCDAASNNERLSEESPEQCPILDVAGDARTPEVILADRRIVPAIGGGASES